MGDTFPIDPRLVDLDSEVMETASSEFERNADLVFLHFRDARNLLYAIREGGKEDRALSKASLLLSSAALESNLIFLGGLAQEIAQKRPGILSKQQILYLKGKEKIINDKGNVQEIPAKQALDKKLCAVPSLLAKTLQRKYELKTRSAAFRKLTNTITRRDAIVHPRIDRYVSQLGWWEAAEALDAVELYLNSIASALHPYLFGYFHALYTIPGNDHHEVAVGHRTYKKRGPKRPLVTMEDIGLLEIISGDWSDALYLTVLALSHGCEGDSEGSMLTRAALVVLYAMLDAQLAVVVQWRMKENMDAFDEIELLFLNEYGFKIHPDGEVWIGEEHQHFKRRMQTAPALLARVVEKRDVQIDLSKAWWKDLVEGQNLRNSVMHTDFGEPITRVTKKELIRSARAVLSFFDELASKVPTVYGHLSIFVKSQDVLNNFQA
jgi:hypothetical protein